jgi:predicted transcriptional regulator
MLSENKQLSTNEIAQAVGRSGQRASTVLAALRLAEVVRYDTDGERNRYRLKQPCEVKDVLTALSRFAQTTRPSGARRIR